jgi:hypothetical protein
MSNLIIGVDKKQKKITEKEIKILKNEEKCQFCSIDISHSSHFHFKEEVWYKSCSLCYYTEHLDKLIAQKKGDLIFMPEISQIELFGLMRMIWNISDLYQKNKNDDHLEEVFDSIKFLEENIIDRKEHAETLFASGVSNVDLIVDYLHSANDNPNFKKPLKYLRWLPNKDLFLEDIEHWAKNDLKKYNPKNFKNLIRHMEKKKNG